MSAPKANHGLSKDAHDELRFHVDGLAFVIHLALMEHPTAGDERWGSEAYSHYVAVLDCLRRAVAK